mmetsp:Transcript_18984/g.53924  ORF Transcript_18984/g.53924 Transcript_18984/m.53924 type:complete len:186 (+) Transcript_18984:168-725(+)
MMMNGYTRVTLILALVSFSILFWHGHTSTSTERDGAGENCDNDKKPVMITPEELALKVDPENEGGKEIWLSIMGEVYDVSAGQEYYGGSTGYGVFAGRDASVPFVTGTFTPEESEKTTEDIPAAQLEALAEWRKFYEDSDKYHFKGFLVDPRWYDEHGEPTEHHDTLKQRIDTWNAMKAANKKSK